MTYLPGETLRVTVVGRVARVIDGDDVSRIEGDWPEIRLDVESELGGVTLAIPLGWPNVQMYGPLSPIYLLPDQQREPDWTWNDEDNPTTCTDPAGRVWDLTAKYHDAQGNVWHWAGGFGRDGKDGPMRPLMSRDDYLRCDVQITDIPGPLTPVAAGTEAGDD